VSVMERAFSADRVLGLTGLTKRQLQYWEDKGLIRPSLSRPDARGRGRPRMYDFRDLVELKTAARLRGAGVSLQQIRRVREHLRALDYEKPFAQLNFVATADGDLVFVESGTIRGGRQPEQALISVTVPLPAIIEELQAQIASLDVRRIGEVERRRGALGSKPVIAGTRIPVITVQRLARGGLNAQQILELYPDLTLEDINAALEEKATIRPPAHATG
jgi:DNA-binding transcriptional MerR regulator